MAQPQELKVDLIALQRLANSLNADLNQEFDRIEATGSQKLSPRAKELLKALQGVAGLAMAARE